MLVTTPIVWGGVGWWSHFFHVTSSIGGGWEVVGVVVVTMISKSKICTHQKFVLVLLHTHPKWKPCEESWTIRSFFCPMLPTLGTLFSLYWKFVQLKYQGVAKFIFCYGNLGRMTQFMFFRYVGWVRWRVRTELWRYFTWFRRFAWLKSKDPVFCHPSIQTSNTTKRFFPTSQILGYSFC